MSCRILTIAACLLLGVDAGIHYRAAVVEIAPTTSVPTDTEGARAAMMRNVEAMERWVGKASQQGAQIVVFPEDFLDSAAAVGLLAPDHPELIYLYAEKLPEPGPADLCKGGETKAGSIAEAVACVAKKYSLIIVSGIGDQGPCATHLNVFNRKAFPCNHNTGLAPLNSMAAFGRDGQLLAKYHKAHVANSRFLPTIEPFAEVDRPEVVTFDSHFGVKFGMFICNDGNFGGPSRGLMKQGVRDIVFSTWWINASPIGVAPSAQDAYSRAYGVNFIAANSDGGGFGSSGSGIWPADTSKKALQHISRKVVQVGTIHETEGWLGVLDLESSASTDKPLSPAIAYPPHAKMVGDDPGTIQVTFVVPKADGTFHADASVPGVACQVDSKIEVGGNKFALIAAAGMASQGWYRAMCSVIACPDGLDESACADMLVSCASGFGSSKMFTCNMKMATSPDVWAAQAPRLGDVNLRIQAPGTNSFSPLAMCNDYLAVEPRSKAFLEETRPEERVWHVGRGACSALGAYSVEAHAQSELEEPVPYTSDSEYVRSEAMKSKAMLALGLQLGAPYLALFALVVVPIAGYLMMMRGKKNGWWGAFSMICCIITVVFVYTAAVALM